MNIGPYLMLYVRSNLKYIIDLNIKTKTVKLLEENIETKLLDTGLGNDFLHLTLKAEVT